MITVPIPCEKSMIFKILMIIILIGMIYSLFSALYFMHKDESKGTRTVKALTARIGIWVVLFILLLVGVKTGLIESGQSLKKASQAAQQPTQ